MWSGISSSHSIRVKLSGRNSSITHQHIYYCVRWNIAPWASISFLGFRHIFDNVFADEENRLRNVHILLVIIFHKIIIVVILLSQRAVCVCVFLFVMIISRSQCASRLCYSCDGKPTYATEELTKRHNQNSTLNSKKSEEVYLTHAPT